MTASIRDYCPYCNQEIDFALLTEEHIIPRSIGGSDNAVILVCKDCNSKAGDRIDVVLNQYSRLKFNTGMPGKNLNFNENHPGAAILYDGRELVGKMWWEYVQDGMITPAFSVKKHQPNGEIWLDSAAVKNPEKLPAGINLLVPEMINWIQMDCLSLENSQIERGLIKILLGTIYKSLYPVRLSGAKGFDLMREAMWSGKMPPGLSVHWIDDPCKRTERVKKPNDHLICFECTDMKHFYGGVHLQGNVAAAITIDDFGARLPQRLMHVQREA